MRWLRSTVCSRRSAIVAGIVMAMLVGVGCGTEVDRPALEKEILMEIGMPLPVASEEPLYAVVGSGTSGTHGVDVAAIIRWYEELPGRLGCVVRSFQFLSAQRVTVGRATLSSDKTARGLRQQVPMRSLAGRSRPGGGPA